MKRVIITRLVVNFCYMQVCAVADASDEEILQVCNRDNPSGTQNGWMRVIREDDPLQMAPVTCNDDSQRKHFLVVC